MERYYPETTRQLRAIILSNYPKSVAMHEDVDHLQTGSQMACYLLWMLEQVQTFTGKRMAARRGRWIGYVQGRMEALHFMHNTMSRKLTRMDVESRSE